MAAERTIGWLEGLTDPVKGVRIEMNGDSQLIGRGSSADVQLNDPQVSREHARIEFADFKLKLTDLDSTHGTFVNGDRVTSISVKNGDRIRFGGSLFHLHVPKGLIKDEALEQDDIATILAPDDIATELADPDEVATVLAGEPGGPAESVDSEADKGERCANCGASLGISEKFCGECGQPRTMPEEPAKMPPGRRLPEAVSSPSHAQPPSVAPPKPPAMTEKRQRAGLPSWLVITLVGLLVVVLAGAGLVLLSRLLTGGSQEEPAAALVSTTSEDVSAFAEESVPTITPLPGLISEPTQADVEGSVPLTTSEAGVPGESTESPPSSQTEAPASSAGMGGAAGIAFASDRTGFPQLFYLNFDSRQITQLTDLPNGACQPNWSPEGARLAFISPCGSNREAYTGSTVFIMDVDPEGIPGDSQPLMASLGGGDYDPDWSPDGSRLAFTSQRTGRPQIFHVGVDGQSPVNVNDDLAHNWSPTWSHDGSQIAFLTGRGGAEEIWFVPASGGEEQRFSRSDGKDVAKPDWSPDGATVLYEKVVGSIPRIVAAPVSEGGVRVVQVCQEGALSLQPMGEPAWSPDGTWLAFETWPGGGDHRIGIMQINCSGYEELTIDPGLDFDAAWRPVP